MVLESIIYDISSSDDEEEDSNPGRSCGLTGLSPNYSKVFNMDLEDDDVVIIDKPIVTGSVRRNKPRPTTRTVMDDDECCILDVDPGASEINDIAPSHDSDELVMTGEKGPVACRDYPHARYLCVHYPFKTTLHAKHCAQCHCYVCDSLAPCLLWGDGSSSNDHCHASDESRWKTLRKLTKCGPVTSHPIPVTGASPIPVAAPTAPLSNVSTGVSRFIRASILLDTSNSSPSSQSPVKKDPLVIKLKSKSRGKPSQPHHLGVLRSPRPHSGNRSSLPSPRTTPSSRVRDEIPPAPPPAPPPPAGAHQFPQVVSGRVPIPQPVPAFKTAPAPPPVQFSLPNAAPYYPPPLPSSNFSVPSYYPPPPLPTSPPPYIPPPPGIYDYAPPGVFDQRLPDVATAPVLDSRYVNNAAPCHDQGQPGYEYLAQGGDYTDRSPAQYPSSSHISSSGDNHADVLTGATEGWIEHASALFDDDHEQHAAAAASSLNDVLDQMAGDDYFWEQFPCW